MTKHSLKPPLLNLSVEEENLAAIPFAVLERRVGKCVGKLEVRGTKIGPDGTETQVLWQVQGNNDLGLPTEQDLDIFVALGVLTFRSNFEKTVTFSGRELAKILNISGVHGKFYRRLKTAMDRFIPLRFRAVEDNEHQEQVKWINVFQEASFSLDKTTNRCTGSITWTDKLVQSMGSGFFRLLDASRYMELDGLTAKHLYRFLTVAFEKSDTVLIDARKLATENLGIVTPPKYLSRLMQTLEPAFEKLMRIEVLGGYHIASAEDWRIALRRHVAYVPERKALLGRAPTSDPQTHRAWCEKLLEQSGMPSKTAVAYGQRASSQEEFYALERAARVLGEMGGFGVLPHVAVSLVRRALDADDCLATAGDGRDLLDWCEIAVTVCRQKKLHRQTMVNVAGLLVKIVKDVEARRRLVTEESEQTLRESFRRREEGARRNRDAEEERTLIFEYEQFREQAAAELFAELPESRKATLRQEKEALLAEQERFARLPADLQQREVDAAVRQDIERREVAPFEKWRLRRRAEQALLPFAAATASHFNRASA